MYRFISQRRLLMAGGAAALLAAAAPIAHAQTTSGGPAATPAASPEQMEQQIQALTREVEALKARPSADRPAAQSGDKSEASAKPNATPKRDDGLLTFHGVRLYGTIDAGLAYMTHGAPLSPTYNAGLPFMVQKFSNRSIFSVAPNGLGTSRIGLSGEEPVTRDLSVVFRLETGFSPVSGRLIDAPAALIANDGVPRARQTTAGDSSRAGQALNGPAYFGLSSKTWGVLTLGRQNSLLLDNAARYDPQQNASAFSPFGYSGFAPGAGTTESAREDKTIKYAYARGPVRFAVMHQFGAAGQMPGHGTQADVGFDLHGFSADATWAQISDATQAASLNAAQAAAAPGTLAATVSDDTAWALQARYAFKRVKVYGGWETVTFANPHDPVAPGSIGLGGYKFSVVNDTAFTRHRIEQVSWFGVRWSATPKLDLTGAYYRYDQNSYKGNGCSDASASSCSGANQLFSAVADYRLTRRFDVYAGFSHSEVSNGLASGFLYTTNNSPMAGARFSF
jgi:predicted porin